MTDFRTIAVIGGAGYVGSRLVPRLLRDGYAVRVLDWYLYGRGVLVPHRALQEIQGDVRDAACVAAVLRGADAVIHLACISNDPSFELNPTLGRAVNFESFAPCVAAAKHAQVRRFIYASSSSVYGINDAPHVTESAPLQPLTDYSRYKAACEAILRDAQSPDFTTLILRPATVCGLAPRLRLDLTVNILTAHAVLRDRMTVFGGTQRRPNLHIDDMVEAYCHALQWDDAQIAGKTYNVGGENLTLSAIAERVRTIVGDHVAISVEPTTDLRSYHICSERIAEELGFRPSLTVDHAIRDVAAALRDGRVPDALTDTRYYNIRAMQAAGLG
ncbi:MAG: SDR family oxidoreductase [Deltaproteobacteria bacterium]|nr:SDR family oxidoreductase [Deltaproteobacteria bacterium]